MIKTKGYFVGLILLFFAFHAFTEELVAPTDVEVDFIEDVDITPQLWNDRIVSGWEALPGQHPYSVSLRLVSREGLVSGCGGVLIHHSWVLTAAHCIARGGVTTVVRVGVTNLTTPEYIGETTVAYNFPMYDSTRPLEPQHNDIALVRLNKPVKYTENARPIRIQSRDDAFRDYSGEVGYASGFGRTWTNGTQPEVLQWVFFNLISNSECRTLYGTLIVPTSICAGPYNETSQSICQGDSGGPLVHVGEDGVPTLIGIASFVIGGQFGCHSGFPGAFIRPGPFHSWFRDVTGIDFENLDLEEEDQEAITTVKPTTTQEPESEESSEESEEVTSEEDSSEEDPELKELMKRLEIEINVKLKMNKLKKRHEIHVNHHERKRNKNVKNDFQN